MTESAAHVAWRADYASQLAAHDKTAASVDGLPLTTIDPANPAASRVTVVKRLAVVFGASGAVGVLIADMQKSPLPPEPLQWVDGYYVAPTTTREFKTVGDIEAALVAALAELAAYISFR
ncbi:MAG TPA: hypothetical protein VHW01_21695 [Polyangiaceae bacterium]|jgi:hypothetical protein|nr:hypothetical protein [Polyangiaceae bacterium]